MTQSHKINEWPGLDTDNEEVQRGETGKRSSKKKTAIDFPDINMNGKPK